MVVYDIKGPMSMRNAIYILNSADGITWTPPVPVVAQDLLNRYQPMLSGNQNYLAVSFYTEKTPLSYYSVVGSRMSVDHGTTWTANVGREQLSQGGGLFPNAMDGFAPCYLQLPNGIYFGDYMGLTPLWAPWETFTGATQAKVNARFFAAWADSRQSCIQHDSVAAIEQHSVGQLFGPQ